MTVDLVRDAQSTRLRLTRQHHYRTGIIATVQICHIKALRLA